MEHHSRVFEIGPCFRPEKPDELHAPEFQMPDLYAADEHFEFLFALAERLGPVRGCDLGFPVTLSGRGRAGRTLVWHDVS